MVSAILRLLVSECQHVLVPILGRTEIVEILLDAGMDPNCIDGASGSVVLLVCVCVCM